MNEIDNRVVEMQFDNKQFEEGVRTSLSTIDRLKQALKFEKTGEGLKELSHTTKSFSMEHMAKEVESISNRFSTMGIIGMRVIQNLTDAAMRFAHRAVSAITEPLISGGIQRAMDTAQAKFMYEGLGLKTTWEEVSTAIGNAVKDTAFGFDEAAKAAAQLGASGVTSAAEMERHLLAIGGTAAMTGSSFSEISDIFTSVAGQGKLMAYQLNQLSFRGLNAAAVLAKQLGTTEAEIREMVHDGKIDFKTFSEAMDSAFGDHAKDANKTFTGALANMKAALKRIGEEVASPSLEHFRDIFNAVKEKINEVHAALGSSNEGFLGTLVTGIGLASTKLIEFIKKLDFSWLKQVADTASNVFLGLLGILGRIRDAFLKLLPPDLSNKFKSLGDALNKWSVGFRDKFADEGLLAKFGKIEQKAETVSQKLYSVTKIAKQVINGDFGNGKKRVKELHKLGYSYSKVQNKVNKLLGCSVRHKETQKDLAAEEKLRVKLQEKLANSTGEVATQTSQADTAFDKLGKVLDGMASVVKMAVDAFSALYRIILKPAVVTMASAILDVSAKVGEKLIELYQKSKENDTFAKGLQKVKDNFLKIFDAVTKVIKALQPFKLVSTTFKLLATAVTTVATGIINLKNKLVAFGNTMGNMPGVAHLMTTLTNLGESLKNLALGAIEKVSSLFTTLGTTKLDFGGIDVLPTILDFAADKLASFIDLLMKGAGYAKDFLGGLGGDSSGEVDTLSGSLDNLSTKVENVKDKSKKFTDILGGFFSRLGENVKGVYDNSKTVAENLARGLVDGFKGINLDKALEWGKLAASIYMIFKIVDLIKSIQGVVDGVASVPKKISAVLGALADAITTYKDSLKSSVIEKLSTAILKIASAMLILSGIPTKQLDAITADIFMVMMGLFAIMKGLSSVTEVSQNADIAGVAANIKNFLTAFISTFKLAANFVGVAALMVGFAAACALLVKTFLDLYVGLDDIQKNWKQALSAFGIMTLMMMELAGIAVLMSALKVKLSVGTGVAFVGLAAAVAILAGVIKVIGGFKPDEVKQGVLAISVLMLMIGVMAKLSSGNSMITAAAGMLVMSLAIAALVPSLWLMAKIPADGISNALFSIVTAFGLLAGLSALSQHMKLDFAKTAGEMALFSVAVLILAKAMEIFAPVADKSVHAFLLMAGTFLILTIGAAVANELGGAMLAFAASLAIAGLAVMEFGAGALMFGMGVEALGKGLSFIGTGLVDLVDGFIEALARITENKDAIAQGITDFITSTTKGVHDGRPSIVQATVDFLTGMAEGLTKATPEILSAISSFGTAMLVTLIGGIGTIIDLACVALVVGVNELSQTIVDNSPALAEAAQNAILSLMYVVAVAMQRLGDAILGPWLDFFPGAREKWDSLWGETQQHIENAMSYDEGQKLTSHYLKGAKDGADKEAPNVLNSVETAVTAAAEKGQAVAEGKIPGLINDPMANEFSRAESTADQGGNSLANKFISAFAQHKGEFNEHGIESAQELLNGIFSGEIDQSKLDEWGISIDGGLADAINANSYLAGDSAENLFGVTDTSFRDAGEIHSPSQVFVRHGQDIIQGLVDGLNANASRVLAPMTKIVSMLSGSMKGKGTGFGATGKSMVDSLSKSISSGASGVKTAFSKLITNCTKAVKDKASSFKSNGTTLMKNLSTGLNSGASKVKDAVKKAVEKAHDSAKNYKSKFSSVGRDMMLGLKNGIISQMSSIASAAADVVSRAISAAKSKADSHSPSRVFMEIGRFLDEGLIIGINSLAKNVAKASGNMAGGAIDKARAQLSSIGDMLDETLSPTITPVVDMSGVYASTRDIDQIFGARSFGVSGNLDAVNRMFSTRQNGSDNSDIISALDKLGKGIQEMPRNDYHINGVTYDDGSNVSNAVGSLVRALRIEGRI